MGQPGLGRELCTLEVDARHGCLVPSAQSPRVEHSERHDAENIEVFMSWHVFLMYIFVFMRRLKRWRQPLRGGHAPPPVAAAKNVPRGASGTSPGTSLDKFPISPPWVRGECIRELSHGEYQACIGEYQASMGSGHSSTFPHHHHSLSLAGLRCEALAPAGHDGGVKRVGRERGLRGDQRAGGETSP